MPCFPFTRAPCPFILFIEVSNTNLTFPLTQVHFYFNIATPFWLLLFHPGPILLFRTCLGKLRFQVALYLYTCKHIPETAQTCWSVLSLVVIQPRAKRACLPASPKKTTTTYKISGLTKGHKFYQPELRRYSHRETYGSELIKDV